MCLIFSNNKSKEVLIHATTGMNLENVMLSERCRWQRSYTVWLNLYEMSHIEKKFIDWHLDVLETRKMGMTANGYREDQNVQN